MARRMPYPWTPGHTVDEEPKRFDIVRARRVESLDRLKVLEMALPI